MIPSSRDMFNAIFLSCWSELQESHQAELADSLQQALTTQNIPEITQTLLNLAEFMEHSEKVYIYFYLCVRRGTFYMTEVMNVMETFLMFLMMIYVLL